MVFTSNSISGTWWDKFNEDDSLPCALDRSLTTRLSSNSVGRATVERALK